MSDDELEQLYTHQEPAVTWWPNENQQQNFSKVMNLPQILAPLTSYHICL